MRTLSEPNSLRMEQIVDRMMIKDQTSMSFDGLHHYVSVATRDFMKIDSTRLFSVMFMSCSDVRVVMIMSCSYVRVVMIMSCTRSGSSWFCHADQCSDAHMHGVNYLL